MGYIYISYSRNDTETARKIQEALQGRGYTTWIDYQDLQSGSVWASQIDEAIRGAEIFIVLLSPQAVESRTIQNEITLAENLQKPIIPVLIERTAIPPSLANRQFVDATSDWESAQAKLMQAVEASAHLPPARRLKVAAPPAAPLPATPAMRPRSPARPIRLAGLIAVLLLVALVVGVLLIGSFGSRPMESSQSADESLTQTQSAAVIATNRANQVLLVLTASSVAQTDVFEETRSALGAPTSTSTPSATSMPTPLPSATRAGSILTLTAEGVYANSTATMEAGSALSVRLTATALAVLFGQGNGPTSTPEQAATPGVPRPTALPETGGGGGKFIFETVVAEAVEATSVAFQATEQSVLSPAEAAQLVTLNTGGNTGVMLATGILAALAVGLSGATLVMMWSMRDVRFRRTVHPTAHPNQPAQSEKVEPDKLLEEYQIFISCSDQDKEWVQILVEDLEALNYLVWWYVKDAPGLPFGNEIRSAIFHTKVFLIVLSPDSMKSKHVEEEIRWAEIYDRPLVPVLHRMIAVEERLYGLAKGADIDFTDEQNYKDSLELLTQAIDHYLKKRLEAVAGV